MEDRRGGWFRRDAGTDPPEAGATLCSLCVLLFNLAGSGNDRSPSSQPFPPALGVDLFRVDPCAPALLAPVAAGPWLRISPLLPLRASVRVFCSSSFV